MRCNYIYNNAHIIPDFSQDRLYKYEGNEVRVPQVREGHSEYLVYKESQVRMRYALKVKMG